MRRIPYVPGVATSDCGAACLAMTLAYHDRAVPLAQLSAEMGVARDGASALALVTAARAHGLRARGVQADVDDLRHLPAGSVLHWELNHFVVLARTTRGGVDIVDPAVGYRRVPSTVLRRSYSGVAVVLEPDETYLERARPAKSPSWRRLWLSLTADPAELRRALVASALIRVLGLMVPLLIALLVNRILPSGDRPLLAIVAAGVAVVVAYQLLSAYVRGRLLLELRTRLDARLTTGFVGYLVDLPYPFFLQRAAGDLLARLGSFANVRDILTTTALASVIDGVLVIAYLIVLFVVSPPLAGLVAILAAAQVLVLVVSGPHTQRLMGENLAAEARTAGYLSEVLSGIETLKASGAEHRAVARWEGHFTDELNAAVRRGRLDNKVHAALDTLRLGSPLAVLLLGGWLTLEGHLALGTTLAAAALATAILEPLSALVTTGLQLRLLESYLQRIDDVLATPTEHEPGRRPPAEPVTGAITARAISYRYSLNAPDVLHHIDLDIVPGQRVALVGSSGGGKTTLAHILLGLYRPTAGQVRFDGVDLAEIDLRLLRQRIGVVTQRSYVFAGTIKDNISLAVPEATPERLHRAAALACIADDIDALPMRYETLLVDGGASLSGGQRQRLAIARALVSWPTVLLLDEATSAIDAVTEQQIHANIAALRVTTLIVAHRLSTIRGADRILVLKDGLLVEQGTHDELLARQGEYTRLLAAQ